MVELQSPAVAAAPHLASSSWQELRKQQQQPASAAAPAKARSVSGQDVQACIIEQDYNFQHTDGACHVSLVWHENLEGVNKQDCPELCNHHLVLAEILSCPQMFV